MEVKRQRKDEAQRALALDSRSGGEVCNEAVTYKMVTDWLVQRYGAEWERSGAEQRKRDARKALESQSLMPDFEARLDAASKIAVSLGEYMRDTKFMGAECFSCARNLDCCHLYNVRMLPGRKKYQGHYVVGCTHEKFDGECWCDNCCTLIRVCGKPVIQCTTCAELDWGRVCNPCRDYYDTRVEHDIPEA